MKDMWNRDVYYYYCVQLSMIARIIKAKVIVIVTIQQANCIVNINNNFKASLSDLQL